jgi:5-aminolevulinate synthase
MFTAEMLILAIAANRIGQDKSIPFDLKSEDRCPHAKAARDAAALAQREADIKASHAGSVPSGVFNYQTFYEAELEKKHKDK